MRHQVNKKLPISRLLKKTLTNILLLFATGMSGQSLPFRHFTTNEGLANSVVYSVIQDSKGYMWFCTETGVSRYDGEQFENFTMADGLADNENFKAFEDSKGRIWFMSYNGRLAYYFKGNFFNEANDPTLRYNGDDMLFDIKEDTLGIIYFTRKHKHMIVYNNREVKDGYLPAHMRYAAYASSPLFKENGDVKTLIIFQDLSYTLYNITRSKKEAIYQVSFESYINCGAWYTGKIKLSEQEHLYGCLKGIANVKHGKMTFFLTKEEMGLAKVAKPELSTPVLSIESNSGYIWVGTKGEGLIRLNYNEAIHHHPVVSKYFDNLTITCVKGDKDGNLWVTTQGYGAYMLPVGNLNFNNFRGGNTNSILALNDSEFISGIQGEFIRLYGKRGQRKIENQTGSKELTRTIGILRSESDNLIIAADNGVYKYNLLANNNKEILSSADGYSCKKINQSSDSSIWIACQKSIFRYNKEKLHVILSTTLEQKPKITSVAGIKGESCYFGTTTRLYKIKGAGTIPDTILNMVDLKAGVTDLKYVNNVLWVGTSGNGILVLRDDKIVKTINSRNSKIVGDICQKLYDDHLGRIWVGTNKGISIFNVSDFSLYYNVTSNDGIVSNDVKDICTTKKMAFIATSEGLVTFPISEMMQNASSPVLHFKRIKFPDSEIKEPSDTIQYKYIDKYFSIDFCIFSFKSSTQGALEYQYRVDDNNWITLQSTEIQAGILDPGYHKVAIKAKKFNSPWSSEKLLIIEVLPLWYQTWLFKITSGLLVLLGIILLIRYRIRVITLREKEKTSVNKQIADLEGKALSNQMNPHFIFNSLNTVQNYIIEQDVKSGVNYLTEFAALMRQILHNSQEDTIYLEDEINFLNNYMKLEQTRFKDLFKYEFHIEQSLLLDEIKIPPMLIQPMLENAIKHGVDDESDDNFVQLSIKTHDDMLFITVEDNGRGYDPENKKYSLGKHKSAAMKVINQRLPLFERYGKPGSIKIVNKKDENPETKGTRIELVISVIRQF